MDRYQWLLVFHVAGAFLVLGGAMLAGIFNIAAIRRERPSEIVALYRLTQIAVRSITLGMLVALVFGIWLVADLDFVKWSNAWVIVALILWGLVERTEGRRVQVPFEVIHADFDLRAAA